MISFRPGDIGTGECSTSFWLGSACDMQGIWSLQFQDVSPQCDISCAVLHLNWIHILGIEKYHQSSQPPSCQWRRPDLKKEEFIYRKPLWGSIRIQDSTRHCNYEPDPSCGMICKVLGASSFDFNNAKRSVYLRAMPAWGWISFHKGLLQVLLH